MFDNFNSHLVNWSFSESSSLLLFMGKALDLVPSEILVIAFLTTVIVVAHKFYRLVIDF